METLTGETPASVSTSAFSLRKQTETSSPTLWSSFAVPPFHGRAHHVRHMSTTTMPRKSKKSEAASLRWQRRKGESVGPQSSREEDIPAVSPPPGVEQPEAPCVPQVPPADRVQRGRLSVNLNSLCPVFIHLVFRSAVFQHPHHFFYASLLLFTIIYYYLS